jgi:ribosomal protein L37AE/L43A
VPISPEACPGVCNAVARRTHAAYDLAVEAHAHNMQQWLALPGDDRPARPEPPAQPSISVAFGAPVWCSGCSGKIRNALYRVNELAPVIYADITGHRSAAIIGPNGTKPLDPKATIEKLDEMYGDLAATASQWKQARRHPDRWSPARGSDARNIVVGYLLEQLDNILRNPGSVDFGLRVLLWEKRLVGMATAEPVSRRSVIRCPRCHERQVSREDDGYYKCRSCGRLLNEAEHDREKFEQADEHDHEQQEVSA